MGSFRDKRAKRIRNERARLAELCAAEPARFLEPGAFDEDEQGVPTALAATIRVRTALWLPGASAPVVRPVAVRAIVRYPRGYPRRGPRPPHVELFSPVPLPLFLGGARMLGPRGMLCPLRDRVYDPRRHDGVHLLMNAYNVLAGRSRTSDTDTVNREAADWWIDHADELPFDAPVGLPDDPPVPADRRDPMDFELVEAP